MEIKQKPDVKYMLTVDEDAYDIIKLALRYTAEANPGHIGVESRELLSIFPSKHVKE